MLDKLKWISWALLILAIGGCGQKIPTKTGLVIPAGTSYFNVASDNAPNTYSINGLENPGLTLERNKTYTFSVRTLGHPFYILNVQNMNTANAYTNGVSGNGVEVGTLIFTVPSTAPDTLYYGSSHDAGMTGVISIIN